VQLVSVDEYAPPPLELAELVWSNKQLNAVLEYTPPPKAALL
jgi:hypothetical protein